MQDIHWRLWDITRTPSPKDRWLKSQDLQAELYKVGYNNNRRIMQLQTALDQATQHLCDMEARKMRIETERGAAHNAARDNFVATIEGQRLLLLQLQDELHQQVNVVQSLQDAAAAMAAKGIVQQAVTNAKLGESRHKLMDMTEAAAAAHTKIEELLAKVSTLEEAMTRQQEEHETVVCGLRSELSKSEAHNAELRKKNEELQARLAALEAQSAPPTITTKLADKCVQACGDDDIMTLCKPLAAINTVKPIIAAAAAEAPCTPVLPAGVYSSAGVAAVMSRASQAATQAVSGLRRTTSGGSSSSSRSCGPPPPSPYRPPGTKNSRQQATFNSFNHTHQRASGNSHPPTPLSGGPSRPESFGRNKQVKSSRSGRDGGRSTGGGSSRSSSGGGGFTSGNGSYGNTCCSYAPQAPWGSYRGYEGQCC